MVTTYLITNNGKWRYGSTAVEFPKKTDSLNCDLEPDEMKVFDVVRQMSGATMEEIISGTGFSPGLANSLVTVMEIKGVIESYAGRIYLSR